MEGTSLLLVLNDPGATVKQAAYTQHPRPPYPDRAPGAKPEVMGVSVRTSTLRYTEWRNFGTGSVMASELYDHSRDEAELDNTVAEPASPAALEQARRLSYRQFPPVQR